MPRLLIGCDSPAHSVGLDVGGRKWASHWVGLNTGHHHYIYAWIPPPTSKYARCMPVGTKSQHRPFFVNLLLSIGWYLKLPAAFRTASTVCIYLLCIVFVLVDVYLGMYIWVFVDVYLCICVFGSFYVLNQLIREAAGTPACTKRTGLQQQKKQWLTVAERPRWSLHCRRLFQLQKCPTSERNCFGRAHQHKMVFWP